MKSTRQPKWFTIFTFAFFGALAGGIPIRAQEVVLLLNAAKQENQACLYPANSEAPPKQEPNESSQCPSPVPDLFVRKGHRAELRVFNRKFLTDYSITVDAVTSIEAGPNIRNLNEAENLTFTTPSFVGAPPSKGGAEGLTARGADQILYELLDETTASKPEADLDVDRVVIDREEARLKEEIRAFHESYELLRGESHLKASAADCMKVSGSPDAQTLLECLKEELAAERKDPWSQPLPGPYTDEQAFRSTVLRVQDLLAAVKTFGNDLANTDLVPRAQKIQSDVAQYENDRLTYQNNVRAAKNALELATQLAKSSYPKGLRREQLKLFLSQQLKSLQGDAKTAVDEAELNELLDRYDEYFSGTKRNQFLIPRWDSLDRAIRICCKLDEEKLVKEFRSKLEDIRRQMGIDLPKVVDAINAAQGRLLSRVNEIYDYSQVPYPLPKQIDVSGHKGNLIVYYTIRRIETFTRFTVTQVAGLPNSGQASLAASVPESKGSTPATVGGNASPASPATGETAAKDQGKGEGNPGIVVARGSFEVHEFFHANVFAAFAFSSLKDQSIANQPTPLGCGGTTANPNTDCFTPILNGGNHQQQVIMGLEYYLRPRDTFPREKWPCSVHVWQCVGPMGGLSVTNANNWFLGGFFEPVLGVQFSGGANFGTEKTLQSPYQFGTPSQITGAFPTYQKRTTGAFFSIGLDLGIFRTIFGKVTGIGTATAATQGN